MDEITDIFDVDPGEDCVCEDCGETKALQFGICIKCGGNVIEKK